MNPIAAANAPHLPGVTRRVLAAGALVGVLDLVWAGLLWVVVLEEITPQQLPQSIAKGLVGSEAAYDGGWRTAGLGLLLHFTIAYGWTLVYLAAVRSWPLLRRQARSRTGAVRSGMLYGALIWPLMTLVVMPLSQVGAATVDGLWLINFCQHALMVGLPIVLLIREG